MARLIIGTMTGASASCMWQPILYPPTVCVQWAIFTLTRKYPSSKGQDERGVAAQDGVLLAYQSDARQRDVANADVPLGLTAIGVLEAELGWGAQKPAAATALEQHMVRLDVLRQPG